MSSPSPVQIREANAHLAALHRRVAELEQRLEAAENTVREQAESLIRKDEQLRAATQEITEAKDRYVKVNIRYKPTSVVALKCNF